MTLSVLLTLSSLLHPPICCIRGKTGKLGTTAITEEEKPTTKCCLLGGWGRGGVWEALFGKKKKTKNFLLFFSLRFYFIFPFVWKRGPSAVTLSQLK